VTLQPGAELITTKMEGAAIRIQFPSH